MTQNNINEWGELTNINHIIAQAVESAFIAYKESDTEAMEEILKNATQRIKEIKFKDLDNFEKKLGTFEKGMMLKANLSFYIERMTSALFRRLEQYETHRIDEHFGVKY